MNKIITVLLMLLSFTQAGGQSLSLLKKVPLKDEVISVSIDRAPHVYLAGKKGGVQKYDENGNLLFTYSPQKAGNIKTIEAWSTLNILLFYEGLQEYRFLDRFLTLTATQSLSPDIFARLITTSTDNNLWVFDDKDYSLKKININYNTPEITTPLTNVIEKTFEGNFLKEYQNLLFLSDINTGIYLFDNLGNYIRILPFPNVSYFNFLNNELYFIHNNALIFYDLYSGKKRTVNLPAEEPYLFALTTEKYLYLIAKKSLDIYAYVD